MLQYATQRKEDSVEDKKKEIKVEVNISGLEKYKAKLNEVLEIIANLEQNIEQLNQIKLEITF